jgi:hypothetical protein
VAGDDPQDFIGLLGGKGGLCVEEFRSVRERDL